MHLFGWHHRVGRCLICGTQQLWFRAGPAVGQDGIRFSNGNQDKIVYGHLVPLKNGLAGRVNVADDGRDFRQFDCRHFSRGKR